MKNKISLLLSLTLLSLFPHSNSYTKKDIERLQSLASMGALCTPIMKIADPYIPMPATNTYQEHRLVKKTKKIIKKFGEACIIMQPILAAATESDENLLSIIDACLLAVFETKPDLFTEWSSEDYRKIGLNVTKIFAKNMGNRFSGKIIKKLCPENGLRIIRRVLRVIAQSAVAGGSEVGAHYIKTKFLGSDEAHLYAEKFLEFAVKALVEILFNETCGEIIAFQITENYALPAAE